MQLAFPGGNLGAVAEPLLTGPGAAQMSLPGSGRSGLQGFGLFAFRGTGRFLVDRLHVIVDVRFMLVFGRYVFVRIVSMCQRGVIVFVLMSGA